METLNIAYKSTYKKDGKEFTQWTQVGKLFKHDDGGMTISMNVIPVGFNGNLSVFVNKKKEVKVNTGEQPIDSEKKEQIKGKDFDIEIEQTEIPF